MDHSCGLPQLNPIAKNVQAVCETPVKIQAEINYDNMIEQEHLRRQEHSISQKAIKKKKRQIRVWNPASLIAPYEHIIPQLIQKPEKSKRKATNIPKFIIKIFYKTLPIFPAHQHNSRLKIFSKQLDSSITRFHLVQLFGLNQNQKMHKENEINRQVLRRLLVRNYDNILSNSHIQHKRIYMLFSKKMLLRLNEPRLVGNIQI